MLTKRDIIYSQKCFLSKSQTTANYEYFIHSQSCDRDSACLLN